MPPRRTRLAPSPTGRLHLGNARTFALTWALAAHEGWEVILRIEDLDVERVRPGAIDDTLRTLEWLGLETGSEPRVQSADLGPYREAMRRLASSGCVFRCNRTRADVRRAASAPHVEEGEVRYEPTLRPARAEFGFVDEHVNHRLLVDPADEAVVDELCGPVSFNPGAEVGDFIVWTKFGVPAYQLAVVVDDIRHGVTDVVRGNDLLASAARQQLLYRALGSTPPRWWHLPLVYGEDGARLAKRHDAIGLSSLRAAAVRRERVYGMLARLCGFVAERREMSRDDFRGYVTPDTLRSMTLRERAPGGAARLTSEDLAWLSGT